MEEDKKGKACFTVLAFLLILVLSNLAPPNQASAFTAEDNSEISAPLGELSIEGKSGMKLAYSYTNKQRSFLWMSTTGKPFSTFSGLNVKKNGVLESWSAKADEIKVTPNKNSEFKYTPLGFKRTTEGGIVEKVSMPMKRPGIIIEYSVPEKVSSFKFTPFLKPTYSKKHSFENNTLLFHAPNREETAWVAITSNYELKFNPNPMKSVSHVYYFDTMRVENTSQSSGSVWKGGVLEVSDVTPSENLQFSVAVKNSKKEAISTAENMLSREKSQKKNHLLSLLSSTNIETSNEDLTEALNLAVGASDSLIMEESYGKAIWAGLPWFNQAWGRDSFISLPGFCLVTGRYEAAKNILKSYAKFQRQSDGRIPNNIQGGSITYGTSDATPWFIKSAYRYWSYTKDKKFLENVLPVVKTAIEGTWNNYYDNSIGFIKSGNQETWMDTSTDPRKGYPIEIQALWVSALLSGSEMAEEVENTSLSEEWENKAKSLAERIRNKFWNSEDSYAYDLLAKNRKSSRIRPNIFIALSTVDKLDLMPSKADRIIKTAFEENLIAPHGVRSLAPSERLFHGVQWATYDQPAYHNGDIWLWLSGPVIETLAEQGKWRMASRIFHIYENHLLHSTNVGTLEEIMDGIKTTSKGCWSQAWSIAEFLRTYYQVFLGISPSQNGVKISPTPLESVRRISGTSNIQGKKIKTTYWSTQNHQKLIADTEHPIETSFSFLVPKGVENVIVKKNDEAVDVSINENRRIKFDLLLDNEVSIKIDYEGDPEPSPYTLNQGTTISTNIRNRTPLTSLEVRGGLADGQGRPLMGKRIEVYLNGKKVKTTTTTAWGGFHTLITLENENNNVRIQHVNDNGKIVISKTKNVTYTEAQGEEKVKKEKKEEDIPYQIIGGVVIIVVAALITSLVFRKRNE